ncbi:hypothetical protein CCMA1212_001289 [Trichoderma ghanense]|uniref:Uncharacterized protein n=1 Tax=Trichoderma ghanense TaxID=65468 RepID=A0ABY2HHT6_9HYPO
MLLVRPCHLLLSPSLPPSFYLRAARDPPGATASHLRCKSLLCVGMYEVHYNPDTS